MSAHCCGHDDPNRQEPYQGAYRRVLWIALVINAAMFLVEIIAGLASGSAALQADALDFFADAGNYGISLFVVGMALRYRARAALFKGATMFLIGFWVFGITIWSLANGVKPHAATMGAVGFAAMIANGIVLALLWTYRTGDSNMRSVWLCSRNDVIGNIAVMLAALGVFGTGTAWPDIIVATIMATLALQGAYLIVRQASAELESDRIGKPNVGAAPASPALATNGSAQTAAAPTMKDGAHMQNRPGLPLDRTSSKDTTTVPI